MGNIYFGLLLCLISSLSFAQTKEQSTKIQGQIVESIQKKPLEFATISLYQLQDSILVSGAISDAKGNFEIKAVLRGQYFLKTQYMGYQIKEIESLNIDPEQSPLVHLGMISLHANQDELKAAEVFAEKSLFQISHDKKVFNVEKSEYANSENATEVLRNVPTIEVTPQGEIKNKGSVAQIYINGKATGLSGDNQAALLRQIPANTIHSIEIIGNPSAKYAPDGGKAGIINIVLKKAVVQGFTGSVSGSLGTWLNKYSSGGHLAYKSQKFNLIGNLNYNRYGSFNKMDLFRQTIFPDSTFYLSEKQNNLYNNHHLFGRIGAEYFINPNQNLAISVQASPATYGSKGQINYENRGQDSLISSLDKRLNDSNSKQQSLNYNAIYSIVFPQKRSAEDSTELANGPEEGEMGGKHELVFDLQYITNNSSKIGNLRTHRGLTDYEQWANQPDSQLTDNLVGHQEVWAKMDYTLPLEELGGELAAGYQYHLLFDQNNFLSKNYDYNNNSFLYDSLRSNHFTYRQDIHAIYGTYSQLLGEVISGEIGLRVEQVFVHSKLINTQENFKLQYLSFYPSLGLSCELGDNQELSFNYSRSVERPSIWEINPFPDYEDPLHLNFGNPYLLPTFSHDFELDYGLYFGKNTLFISNYMSFLRNVIEDFNTVNSQGIATTVPKNVGKAFEYGADLYFKFQPFDWWNLSTNFGIEYLDQKIAMDSSLNFKNLTGSLGLSTNFNFKFGLRISATANYYLPDNELQGRGSDFLWSWLSLSQKFLKDKLVLSFQIQNPFRNSTWTEQRADNNFNFRGHYIWEARVATLRLNYNFGKVNIKQENSKLKTNVSGDFNNSGGGKGKQ